MQGESTRDGPRWGFTAGVVLALLAIVHLRLRGVGLLSDEQHHVRQILAFVVGDWSLLPSLTTLPTWHLLSSGVARLGGAEGIDSLRLVNVAAAALALAVFGLLARELQPRGASWRVLQAAALPVLLPLACLVYTDLPALAAGLGCALLTVRKQPLGAGALAVLTVAMRQTNVVLVIALLAFAALEAVAAARSEGREPFGPGLRSVLPYVPALGLFVGFVAWNGGVALGEKGMHPTGGLHLGNVVFGLAGLPLLFAPWWLQGWRRTVAWLRPRPLVPAVCLLVGLGLSLSWSNDHPYNQAEYGFFLHNKVALWLSSGLVPRLLGGALAGVGLLLLVAWRPERRAWALVLWLVSLGLLGAWLVEPRYLLTPALLLLAAREPMSPRWEGALLVLWLLPSMLLVQGIVAGSFFP